MKAKEIREKYLSFFEKKGHKIIPSSSLVPENDPTVLFTTAGMHPLVPYLLGEKHPLGNRLVNVQKCIRTDDIDEVGDNTHNTFFEMLGNWSLGDYFKKESIEWSFEFLTKELNIPLERLAVTVFEGEDGIARDQESASIWKGLGVKSEKIAFLGRKDNWWGLPGKTGPCGPDTEIFYYIGEDVPDIFNPKDEKWVEIWNNVFMEYNKQEEGFVPLAKKNVDTGMGLERITTALQGKDNVFETELFLPLISKIQELSQEQDEKAERIIADHIKASVFLLAEKITPSNTERGYSLRRLIRRAIRYGKILGIKEMFLSELAPVVIFIYDIYPELEKNKEDILLELEKEEKNFNKTLEKGLKEFNKIEESEISGQQAFYLYQSYGFPIEMTIELAKEKGKQVDVRGFDKELKKHQELSRTAGKFKSGLADCSEQTIKYHTVAHLLHATLREVLGKEVEQRGSNITSERVRFDFTFARKMTEEERGETERIVNEKIQKGFEVKEEEMSLNEALNQGALAFFRDKYPEKVKVYTIFDPENKEVFSKEICSGPHASCLKDFGHFKIIKEQSSSAGVRRIKAVLE